MKLSIQEILRNDSRRIEVALGLAASTARIEVQMLLQYVLAVVRSHLLAYPEQILDEKQAAEYLALVARRLSGEPIAYIIGMREFYGLEFKVTPAALIPRPETELLVEQALQHITQTHAHRMLDLGTGSGAIALSIAHARPDIEVIAVDASQDALTVARDNAKRLNIGNVHFLLSDWLSELQSEHFDLIVSNPPYIASDDKHLTQGDLRFEPRSALASGLDGLADIRQIISQAKLHLKESGRLLLEHGYDQAVQVRSLLQLAGFVEVNSWSDLSGIERVSGGMVK